METIMKVIGGVVLVTMTILFIALIGGTVVWLVWPIAIPAAFPGLVASGALAGKLSWWVSVCLVWIFGTLIKSNQTNNNNK